MDWRQAIKDSSALGIDRLSVFLTGLEADARQECYRLLHERRRSGRFEIPFVHARHDMAPDEYRMFMAEFGTERFNLHPVRKTPLPETGLPHNLRQLIYIENVGKLLESDLEGFAGICVDVSHLEITRRVYPDYYPTLCALIESYPIGANHVSAYSDVSGGEGRDDKHLYESLSEFDYLRRYPLGYFGRYVAMELNNPLSEQLAVKDWLEKHLGLS